MPYLCAEFDIVKFQVLNIFPKTRSETRYIKNEYKCRVDREEQLAK